MVLPIYAYGHEVLKKVGVEIDQDYPELKEFIESMWETMYHAKGVGLAAHQVGHPIRIFIVDTVQVEKEGTEGKGIKKIFINAEILEESKSVGEATAQSTARIAEALEALAKSKNQ